MAIVATNRKRSDKCFSLSQQTTTSFKNLQALKKRRFLDKSVSSSSNATTSRYPASKLSIRRKFHARCRGFLRFRLLVRASIFKIKAKPRNCFGNEEIIHESDNLFGRKYAAKKATLRLQPFGDSTYEDSSIDREILGDERSSTLGVRNGKVGNNLRVSSLRKSRPLMEKPVQALQNRRFSDKLVSSSNATISRLSRHSAKKVSLRREFLSCCRGSLRFRIFFRASVFKRRAKPIEFCDNEDISRETGNFFGHNKNAAKRAASVFHHFGDSIYEDSRTEEVQVVRHDKENLFEEHSTTRGVWNGKIGNILRVSLLHQSLQISHEPFLRLKEEEEAEVKSAFSEINRMKVLVSHKNSNIDIRGETLQCLRPTAWLNDEVINLYLELLKERETRSPQKYFKCHFFNTFFYVKLARSTGYNYEAVRRWTTQRKLGYNLIDCDIIFLPIHGGVHWTLAVINIRECKFLYLDSLNGYNPKILNSLAKYLVDEVKDKSGKNIDVSSWDSEYVKDLPRQQNGYDCGMFMLKYIDFYSRGLKLHFSQKDMPYFRLRTAKEILRLRAH